MNDNDLNRKIHEKLFGAKWFRWEWESVIIYKLATPDHFEDLLDCGYEYAPVSDPTSDDLLLARNKPLTELPNYTENLTDAFLIVGEMERRGFDFEFLSRSSAGKTIYSAEFVPHKIMLFDTGKTLSLAICKACEKYLESKNGLQTQTIEQR